MIQHLRILWTDKHKVSAHRHEKKKKRGGDHVGQGDRKCDVDRQEV